MKTAVMQERRPGPGGPPAPGAGSLFYMVPVTREITIKDLLPSVSDLVSGGAASAAELTKVARKPDETYATRLPTWFATEFFRCRGMNEWR
jgi:hypothetical protein